MSNRPTENRTTEEDKEAKLQAFWENARRGVLTFLAEQGESLRLDRLHDYSLKTYFIQHQRFSLMMETFVDEALIEYDDATQVATITEKGRAFIR